MKQKMRLVIVAAVAISLLMFLYSNRNIYIVWLDIQKIESLIPENPFLQLLVTLLIMIVQNLFPVIPLVLVITLNIVLFGFAYGYAWSVLTSIIASYIIFYIIRKWSSNWDIRILKHSIWMDRIAQRGYLYVFLGRVTPIVPTSIINIAAGLSKISTKHFLISTIVGNGLYFLILAFLAHGLLSSDLEYSEYVIMAIFILGYVFFRLWKYYRSKK